MTTVPEQPDSNPMSQLPDPGLDAQLRAAQRELVFRRIEAARRRAELHAAQRHMRLLRGHQRAVRRRALRRKAMRAARITARIVLTMYGMFALFDAMVLLIHGHPSVEMFTAAATALGAAAVIPRD